MFSAPSSLTNFSEIRIDTSGDGNQLDIIIVIQGDEYDKNIQIIR
jgi:hypothetical protein